MRPPLVLVVNALLPGCLLPWYGAPIRGALLMAAAAAGLSISAIGAALATPEWLLVTLTATLAYLALAATATITLWWLARPRPLDRKLITRLHHEAAAAYLRGDRAALTAAQALVRAAPAEPGAWRLLDLIARATGDLAVAARAARRAAHLETAEG